MKTKFILSFLTLLLSAGFLNAQVSRYINYQAVARDNAGLVFQNQTITVRLTIRSGTAGGPSEYQESHNVTTNNFGTFSVKIGSSTSGVTGNYNTINWGDAARFLEVELIPPGGSTFIPMGTTELISVPHALYAETAGNNQWNSNGNEISNSNSGNVGIGVVNPTTKFTVQGGSDASPTGGGYILSGNIAANNIVIDNNEIMARDNGVVSPLLLNAEGGNLIFNGSNAAGFVGIKTGTPLSDLHIVGASGGGSIQGDRGIDLENAQFHWRIYNSNDYVRYNYSNDNGVTYTPKAYVNSADGSWNQVSDASMKHQIEDLKNVLTDVMRLKPLKYLYNDNQADDQKSMGFLAQDVQKIFPEVVSHEKGETLLGIDYSKFAVIAIKAIQEQQQQILELIKSNEELKTMILKLQK